MKPSSHLVLLLTFNISCSFAVNVYLLVEIRSTNKLFPGFRLLFLNEAKRLNCTRSLVMVIYLAKKKELN